MKYVFFLAALLLIVGFAGSAFADCMSGCLEEQGCDLEQASQGVDPDSVCMTSRDECEARCHHSDESYGAVAYGKTSGAWGMSGSFDSKKSAQADALRYCHENGNDCKIVLDLFEACAAVAEGDNDVIAWGKEATAVEAQNEAMRACAKKAGNNCEVQLWHCYYP